MAREEPNLRVSEVRRPTAKKNACTYFRIMMQPIASKGVVAKPNSSAPSRQAIATSRPVRICPSVCSVTRPAEERIPESVTIARLCSCITH